MVEQISKLTKGNEKAIEKVLFDENVHYLHMVFPQSDGLPEHFSNSSVYMTGSGAGSQSGLTNRKSMSILPEPC